MRLLLDTHALVWWLLNDERLSRRANDLISDPGNRIFASAVSAFEMATKHRLGKWPEIGMLAATFEDIVIGQDFAIIPISAGHAARAGMLSGDHRDPFDRFLAAQAQMERLYLLTKDHRLADFRVDTIW
ncbi:MAG TPA: type II toxin-antitoxin system VapC family toxin [Aquamicrobium sp.]|nr:type II toxin-antitoxin system VapC family toxin [Aquamicrobium sp.]